MGRTERRHHRQRLKNKRRFHWGRDLLNDKISANKAIDTPCPCSCYACGNPRKYFKQKTMQERKADELMQE